MAACAEGRSTVTGTRRSRSHGEATLAVSSASTQTCQLDAIASSAPASPRCRRARCTVSAQNSAIAVQPPNRCESSNTLCARLRTGGAAQATTSSASATRQPTSTRVVAETLAGWRARATVATTANAHSHAVPASAAPAWMPPTWCTFETLQRSHSGHDARAAAGEPEEHVEHGLLADQDRAR